MVTTHVLVPVDDETVEKLRAYGIPLEDVIGRVITVVAPRIDPEILASILLKADRRPQGVSMLSSRGVEEMMAAVRDTNRLVKKLEADVRRVEKLLGEVKVFEEQRRSLPARMERGSASSR